MKLLIAYKNSTSDEFSEEQLDCKELTIRGHASKLVSALKKGDGGRYAIDNYNCVDLSETLSVRVI